MKLVFQISGRLSEGGQESREYYHLISHLYVLQHVVASEDCTMFGFRIATSLKDTPIQLRVVTAGGGLGMMYPLSPPRELAGPRHLLQQFPKTSKDFARRRRGQSAHRADDGALICQIAWAWSVCMVGGRP